jgi:hypothetical protein
MFLLAKYGVQTTFTFPIVKRGLVDLAATGDWTPATGDTKISKDGGNVANTTNNPSAVGGTGSVMWTITLTATELQAAVVDLQIVDSATKAVEDQTLKIYTYGNASAKVVVDWSDTVRMGLTALPNAAAEAAGGLFTRGTGAGQINQDANGRVDVSLKAILGTTITETAGQIAAAFKQFFDVASPTGTMKALTNVVSLTTNNDKTGYALTSGERTSIADAMLDETAGVETGLTVRQHMRLVAAALFGKASGLATTTATFRDTGDTKDRIVATVDANGNRTAVTTDPS